MTPADNSSTSSPCAHMQAGRSPGGEAHPSGRWRHIPGPGRADAAVLVPILACSLQEARALVWCGHGQPCSFARLQPAAAAAVAGRPRLPDLVRGRRSVCHSFPAQGVAVIYDERVVVHASWAGALRLACRSCHCLTAQGGAGPRFWVCVLCVLPGRNQVLHG